MTTITSLLDAVGFDYGLFLIFAGLFLVAAAAFVRPVRPVRPMKAPGPEEREPESGSAEAPRLLKAGRIAAFVLGVLLILCGFAATVIPPSL